jgi:hypothetical protein
MGECMRISRSIRPELKKLWNNIHVVMIRTACGKPATLLSLAEVYPAVLHGYTPSPLSLNLIAIRLMLRLKTEILMSRTQEHLTTSCQYSLFAI